MKMDSTSAAIALEKLDLSRYSVMAAIRSMVSRGALSGLELECSQMLGAVSGVKARGFLVPWRVLAEPRARRALDTTSGVGALKAGTAAEAIQLLRPLTMLSRLGAVIMDGLVGSFNLPRQSAATSMQWVAADGSPPSGSNPTFDGVKLSPNYISGYVDVTRSFLAQSSVAVETLLRDDLFQGAAVAIDTAGIGGSGASGNQPLGILNNTSVAVHSLGTDGGVPAWADIIQLAADVDQQNVNTDSAAFLTTPGAKGLLKITEKVSGYPKYLWDDNGIAQTPAFASNIVPSNLTKGDGTNLSALIYGVWSDLVIGLWADGIDLVVNPYTLSSSGGVRISLHIAADVELRHPESFACFADINTSSIAPNS